MSTEANKAVARRFVDANDKQDTMVITEVSSPDLAKTIIEEWIPRNNTIWADARLEITEMTSEGDKVWVRLVSTGRQIGEWQGLPPTGKNLTANGIVFLRVSSGKVVEFASMWDNLSRIQQLGGKIVPAA